MGSSVRARVLGGPGIVGLAARAAHDLGRVEDGRVALHHALYLLHVDLLATRVDAGRLASEEDEAPVVGITRAVAAEAVADAVDHREGIARALGVVQVAEREMALGG